MPIDNYGFSELYGWVVDKFGVSWQITPTIMNDLMHEADPAALDRITKAFLQMKKLDLAELERAYKGVENKDCNEN